MADAVFEIPRLARIYDLLEAQRPDLDLYFAVVKEFRAESVLDIGCGTGTLACLLAQHDVRVTGVDPAAASLDVARGKPFSDRVRWVMGDATIVPSMQVDLVTMTGNVAQVFLTDDSWSSTLRASYGALRPGGRLVFEVRDPAKMGWAGWTRHRTYRRVDLPDIGIVEAWTELTEVGLPLVAFRQHFVFAADHATIVSDSTLRFRNPSELSESLVDAGFVVDDIRDAPDRPGSELVFIASRSDNPARREP